MSNNNTDLPHWTYNGLEVHNIPYNATGFVYCIHFVDGTRYYGKKNAKQQKK